VVQALSWLLVKALVKAGQQVRILDNLSMDSIENLADILSAWSLSSVGTRSKPSRFTELTSAHFYAKALSTAMGAPP
jgi:nucleoside-diphosphate-sugar epimerase